MGAGDKTPALKNKGVVMTDLKNLISFTNVSRIQQSILDTKLGEFIRIQPGQSVSGEQFIKPLSNLPTFRESIEGISPKELLAMVKEQQEAKFIRHLIEVEERTSSRVSAILVLKWRLRRLEGGKNEPEPNIDSESHAQSNRAA
jgi:hypothetical protein